MQRVKRWWWLAALAAGSVVGVGLFGARSVQAQGTPQAPGTGIAVIAEGQVSAPPDVAYVNLGVQTEAQTAQAAMQANSQTIAAVIAAVQGAGIPENKIRTVGVNVSPITAPARPGEGTPPQTVGYRAMNTINVTVDDVAKAGAVLDAGVGAGANVANGLSFGFKDASALRRQALDQAARAARADADAVAAALGVRISGIRLVEEQGGGTPSPLPRAMAADAAGGAVPVQPGQLTVTSSVRVVFDFA
jgi:uncharacterized protein YggE